MPSQRPSRLAGQPAEPSQRDATEKVCEIIAGLAMLFFIVLLAGVGIGAAIRLFHHDPLPVAPNIPPPHSTTTPDPTMPGDGLYTIGNAHPAGTYKTGGGSGRLGPDCAWAVDTGFAPLQPPKGGSGPGPQQVILAAGDVLSTTNCQPWIKVK